MPKCKEHSNHGNPHENNMAALTAGNYKNPKLIVFDIDYTLWPFWVDTHVRPPFSKKNRTVVDSSGYKICGYRDVPQILEELHKNGYVLALASRTEWPDGARQLLKLLDWNKYFTYQEIYPGSKVKHFKKLHDETGIPYNKMMFFDDEPRNIMDIKKIGVTCIHVTNGMTKEVVDRALQEFRSKS